jgi:hypothetical protein
MHRGIVGETPWEGGSTGSRPKPENDLVQGSTLVDAPMAGFLWRVVLSKDRLDLLPQLLRCVSDGGQWLLFGRMLGHGVSSRWVSPRMITDHEGFEIVGKCDLSIAAITFLTAVSQSASSAWPSERVSMLASFAFLIAFFVNPDREMATTRRTPILEYLPIIASIHSTSAFALSIPAFDGDGLRWQIPSRIGDKDVNLPVAINSFVGQICRLLNPSTSRGELRLDQIHQALEVVRALGHLRVRLSRYHMLLAHLLSYKHIRMESV